MALPSLRDVMSKATAGASAAALAATLIASPPATNDAHAQSVKPVAAAVATKGSTSRALADASVWSSNNPLGVAVAVYLGTDGQVTPAKIEQVLTRDFKANGVDSVRFFYAQNDQANTGFSLHANGVTLGVFTVLEVRSNVPVAARQVALARLNPAFANN